MEFVQRLARPRLGSEWVTPYYREFRYAMVFASRWGHYARWLQIGANGLASDIDRLRLG